jgi:hypothetical protein
MGGGLIGALLVICAALPMLGRITSVPPCGSSNPCVPVGHQGVSASGSALVVGECSNDLV